MWHNSAHCAILISPVKSRPGFTQYATSWCSPSRITSLDQRNGSMDGWMGKFSVFFLSTGDKRLSRKNLFKKKWMKVKVSASLNKGNMFSGINTLVKNPHLAANLQDFLEVDWSHREPIEKWRMDTLNAKIPPPELTIVNLIKVLNHCNWSWWLSPWQTDSVGFTLDSKHPPKTGRAVGSAAPLWEAWRTGGTAERASR